jgi:hypothetical protein
LKIRGVERDIGSTISKGTGKSTDSEPETPPRTPPFISSGIGFVSFAHAIPGIRIARRRLGAQIDSTMLQYGRQGERQPSSGAAKVNIIDNSAWGRMWEILAW